MKRTFLPFYALMIGFLIVLGCAVPEEEDILTVGYMGGGNRGGEDELPGNGVDVEQNHMAIFELNTGFFRNPDEFEKYSKAKVLIVQPTYIWGPDFDPNIFSSIRAINPEIKILGYVSAHATWERWGGRDVEDYPYQTAWYEATQEFWSYTTTGDTMMSWPGKILLNTLEEDCQDAMIGVLASQWASYPNVLDGIFWDHFNTFLWVPSHVEGRYGEMDMNKNGIPHRDDQDEMQAYRDASTSLVQKFSAVLGPDLIQVTNGNRAAKDSVFAGLIDGMMYEIFPTVGYNGEEMQNSLNPLISNNLFAANNWPRTSNGGPYLILTNSGHITVAGENGENEIWRRADFNRVVALLTDSYVSYHPESEEYSFGWPEIELNLGSSIGDVELVGNTIYRSFDNGHVRLDFSVGNSNAPFQFEIVQNGLVVQQFMLE